jgi:hypothetical protein
MHILQNNHYIILSFFLFSHDIQQIQYHGGKKKRKNKPDVSKTKMLTLKKHFDFLNALP